MEHNSQVKFNESAYKSNVPVDVYILYVTINFTLRLTVTIANIVKKNDKSTKII